MNSERDLIVTLPTFAKAQQKAVAALIGVGYDRHEAWITSSATLDAVAGTRHAHLLRAYDFIDDAASDVFAAHLQQLLQGRPLRYVLGECEFFGIRLLSDERALIPRPETETLVEHALQRLKNCSAARVADLGTGSGCIAIAIASNLGGSQVYASDASADSLALAKLNADLTATSAQIEFVQGAIGAWAGPLLSACGEGGFDAILTNPPYIASAAMRGLQPQIRDYEPPLALDGGSDGLQCYRQIASQCRLLLAPHGVLLAELGDGQYDHVRRIFEDEGWQVLAPLHDLAGIQRVLVAEL